MLQGYFDDYWRCFKPHLCKTKKILNGSKFMDNREKKEYMSKCSSHSKMMSCYIV